MLTISSPAFLEMQMIPSQFTCEGENVNPPLEVNQFPPGTVSWALIVNDPDAPAGNWTHWILWNIGADVEKIKQNSIPNEAVVGTNSWGKAEYGGPCPPSGTHRYQFNVYALDCRINLSPSARQEDLIKEMQGKILMTARLTGLYKKGEGGLR